MDSTTVRYIGKFIDWLRDLRVLRLRPATSNRQGKCLRRGLVGSFSGWALLRYEHRLQLCKMRQVS